ncbi:MAG: hypothetical protein E7551_04765 [Ruminococcaceae bacterium]|nr:hypothetical protein [Oscillospiraceae bacterium]
MEFLNNNQLFDFIYGGTPFGELEYEISKTENGNTLTTIYSLSTGLKITNVLTKHGDAYEWVNYFENTSDTDSEIISDLWDCAVQLPLPYEEPYKPSAYLPDIKDMTLIYNPCGSNHIYNEFTSDAETTVWNRKKGEIRVGQTKSYAPLRGRSSYGIAPFFNIHKSGEGYVIAIGWTGQWNCSITRNEDSVTLKSKIEATNFKLLSGERIRTSSIVIMPYKNCDFNTSQNKWRRLVKSDFSLIGSEGREKYCPICASIWGGMKTSSILKRLEIIKEHNLPYEYIWMDAGWCGGDTKPTPDEFEGDWAMHTGDWQVSPLIHPGHLTDVAEAIHKMGKKFILWFEPERVLYHLPIVAKHPEYFLTLPNAGNLLLDLGNPKAFDYCCKTIGDLIEKIGVDCYRQDFNMDPIDYWRSNENDDRKGIAEIKHITGLYAFWDYLLERFPHLIIDNCASGGRRIDIETLRRSVPLWRSDYQCAGNYPNEGSQCHQLGFNTWLPYSGTGGGRDYDTYRIRSSYSPGLTTNYAYSEHSNFGNDPENLLWITARITELKKLRLIMDEDFYPLTSVSDNDDIWSALQFDHPSTKDGAVLLFRRKNAPYETAIFTLRNIDENAVYIFTDADNNNTFTLMGSELKEKGFKITVPEKETAKIYFYKNMYLI